MTKTKKIKLRSIFSKFTFAFIGLSVATQIAYNALSFSAVYFDFIEGYNSLYVSIPCGFAVFVVTMLLCAKLNEVLPLWQKILMVFLGILSWLDPSLFSIILAVITSHISSIQKFTQEPSFKESDLHNTDILDR